MTDALSYAGRVFTAVLTEHGGENAGQSDISVCSFPRRSPDVLLLFSRRSADVLLLVVPQRTWSSDVLNVFFIELSL